MFTESLVGSVGLYLGANDYDNINTLDKAHALPSKGQPLYKGNIQRSQHYRITINLREKKTFYKGHHNLFIIKTKVPINGLTDLISRQYNYTRSSFPRYRFTYIHNYSTKGLPKAD